MYEGRMDQCPATSGTWFVVRSFKGPQVEHGYGLSWLNSKNTKVISVSIKFTADLSFERKLEDLIAERLNAVGYFLDETFAENLSVDYYPERQASLPGEYPRMRTEFLRNESMGHAFDRMNMEIIVGPSFSVPYVESLVRMDRLFAYATLEENIDRVVSIFYAGA